MKTEKRKAPIFDHRICTNNQQQFEAPILEWNIHRIQVAKSFVFTCTNAIQLDTYHEDDGSSNENKKDVNASLKIAKEEMYYVKMSNYHKN